MSSELEIEFKNMVTEKEFTYLLNTFNISNKDFFLQTNHYFDTKHFLLKQKNAALRVRELPRGYELTLKKPHELGNLEFNQKLTEQVAVDILKKGIFPVGEIRNELKTLSIDTNQLRLFGSLTTKRAEIEYKNGLLVFDHSYYSGMEDYEIEYESDHYDVGKNIFYQLLEKLNIPVRRTDNKIRRLYRSLN